MSTTCDPADLELTDVDAESFGGYVYLKARLDEGDDITHLPSRLVEPDDARELAEGLLEAADEAEQYVEDLEEDR